MGKLMIKLPRKIKVNALIVAHAAPYKLYKGSIKSAPRNFAVFGLESSSPSPILISEFEFSPLSNHYHLEKVNFPDAVFDGIFVKITSNWGNPDWTCVYRIGVHGTEIE
jgi:hypothetical protein